MIFIIFTGDIISAEVNRLINKFKLIISKKVIGNNECNKGKERERKRA